MNVADAVRARVARWVLKGAQLPSVPAWLTQSFLHPTFHRLVFDGYRKNAAVFACISALNFSFMEPPIQVYADERDDAPVIPKHPLRQLLANPNALMGEAELAVITMNYLAIGGNAYWHKVRNKRGQVVEVWPYHAGNFLPVPGGDTWIKRYDFDDGSGSLVPIDPADVVHFKWPAPDPTQPWMAQPPLLAAAYEVDTDTEATRYLFALLANDAVPRTIIKSPPGTYQTEDEVRRAKAQFKERYGGNSRGEVMILESGMDVARLGLDLQQLAFEALHRIPETRIAAAFRVPAIVAGLSAGLERSTYANYGQARQAFTRDTLVPLWRIVASEVTADLMPEVGGPQGEARHDLKRVVALREDTDKQWGRVTQAYTANIITQNEARAALGFGRQDGGDETVRPPAPKALGEGGAGGAKGGAKGETPASEQIFAYHIDAGAVDLNEVRERLGLPPRADVGTDLRYRELLAAFNVAQQAAASGYPIATALAMAGLTPEGELDPARALPPDQRPALPGPAPAASQQPADAGASNETQNAPPAGDSGSQGNQGVGGDVPPPGTEEGQD